MKERGIASEYEMLKKEMKKIQHQFNSKNLHFKIGIINIDSFFLMINPIIQNCLKKITPFLLIKKLHFL